MHVTIITDASHCGQTGVAGWSCWMVSARGKASSSGAIKGKVRDSLVAEAMAVVNSIHCVIKRKIAMRSDNVLVQTDCLSAIHHLGGGRNKKEREDIDSVVKAFQKLKAEHDLTITFKHVKGHTKNDDKRSKAQRIQDRQAKGAMKGARKKVRDVHEQYKPGTYRPLQQVVSGTGGDGGSGTPDASGT